MNGIYIIVYHNYNVLNEDIIQKQNLMNNAKSLTAHFEEINNKFR